MRTVGKAHGASGFTLVEVMVAILVLALIGLASASVFQQMLQAEEVARKRHEQLAALQFAFLIMDRDIRQMSARTTRIAGNQDRIGGDSGPIYLTNSASELDSEMGALGFVRAGWTNPNSILPRSELQAVVYRVWDNQLQRLYVPFVDDVSGDIAKQTLLEGVEAFEVTFEAGGSEANSWEVPGQLPTRVRIRLELAEFGEIERVILTSGERPEPRVNVPPTPTTPGA